MKLIWKDKELKTFGDIADAVIAVETREEAQEFMAAYRATDPEFADGNIGYLAGYYNDETAKRIWDWFGTSHPIFGTTYPSAKDAFAAGQKEST